MKTVLKKHENLLPNGDLVIIEIVDVGDSKYQDGIMFTFRCMSESGETLFAIENSHGKPHIHLKNRKEDVDWSWKVALAKFDEMVKEHRKRILW